MAERETPRTDAWEKETIGQTMERHAYYGWKRCRILERDLSAARDEIARLKGPVEGIPTPEVYRLYQEKFGAHMELDSRGVWITIIDYERLASYTRKVAEERDRWSATCDTILHRRSEALDAANARAESAEARLKAVPEGLPLSAEDLAPYRQNAVERLRLGDEQPDAGFSKGRAKHDLEVIDQALTAISLHADNAALKGRVEGLEEVIREAIKCGADADGYLQQYAGVAKLAALTGEGRG